MQVKVKLNGKKAGEYKNWIENVYNFEKKMIQNSSILYIKLPEKV